VFSQPVRSVMRRQKFLTASPATTVASACVLMAKRNVGAVIVVQRGRLVGIFTERDAVFRVVAQGRDPRITRLVDVMTTAPATIAPDKSYGHALLIMHENSCRHVPVIEDGKPIGIVSARSALDPEMEEFEVEAQRRRHLRQTLSDP